MKDKATFQNKVKVLNKLFDSGCDTEKKLLCLSLKSHDPSQRANGFLTLAGGVIITFAKEILTLITG